MEADGLMEAIVMDESKVPYIVEDCATYNECHHFLSARGPV